MGWLKLERLTLSSVGKDVEKLLHPYNDVWNVKWWSHFGKHSRIFI